MDSIEEAHCMHCKHTWSRQFIANSMTRTFLANAYKQHREDIVIDRERSKLAATLPYVASCKRAREAQANITQKRRLINALELEIDELQLIIFRENEFQSGTSGEETKEKNGYLTRGHCPKADCNGFIGEGWACIACDTRVCNRCLEDNSDEQHQCDPTILQNVEQVRKNSKPCPKCRARTFRASGCRQMFCTVCHTPWDWNTGREITTGAFHNPHFAEWQHANGRDDAAFRNIRLFHPDNGCVTHAILNERVRSRGETDSRIKYETLASQLNACNHLLEYNTAVPDPERQFRDLRVKHIMAELDNETFKTRAQRIDKAYSKRREVTDVIRMYATVAKDLIAAYCNYQSTFHETCSNITRLRIYSEQAIRDINKWYGHPANSLRNALYTGYNSL